MKPLEKGAFFVDGNYYSLHANSVTTCLLFLQK